MFSFLLECKRRLITSFTTLDTGLHKVVSLLKNKNFKKSRGPGSWTCWMLDEPASSIFDPTRIFVASWRFPNCKLQTLLWSANDSSTLPRLRPVSPSFWLHKYRYLSYHDVLYFPCPAARHCICLLCATIRKDQRDARSYDEQCWAHIHVRNLTSWPWQCCVI